MKHVSKVVKVFGVLLVQGALATAAQAYSVDITYDNRYVRSNGNVNSESRTEQWSVTERSTDAESDFNANLDETRSSGGNSAGSSATMDSSNSVYGFSADGTVSGFSYVANPTNTCCYYNEGVANSFYEVRFTLTEETAFDLDVLLEFDREEGTRSRGGASFSLQAQNFSLSIGNNYLNSDYEQGLKLSGILDPNTYTLRVSASVDAENYYRYIGREAASAAYSMNMNLHPVPVPAAVWLFGSGLGLLVGWKRHTRGAIEG